MGLCAFVGLSQKIVAENPALLANWPGGPWWFGFTSGLFTLPSAALLLVARVAIRSRALRRGALLAVLLLVLLSWGGACSVMLPRDSDCSIPSCETVERFSAVGPGLGIGLACGLVPTIGLVTAFVKTANRRSETDDHSRQQNQP